jgi:hypothetical protein
MSEHDRLTPEQLREQDRQSAVRPPEMTVLSDHPILREDDTAVGLELEPDSFGLRARLGAIYDIIRHRNTRAPLAIAIYGDWGTGKSSAMRWLRDQLAQWSKQSKAERKGHMKIRSVWFDPWKYQKREDVWRGLIAEVILHSIDINNASLATITNAAKKFGLFLGRSFLNVLSSAKLKAGAKPIGGEAEINLDVLKKIAEDYHQTAHPEKAYLNEFETTLKDWVGESLKADERMVIFIDDLDRCLPEVTFEVLEALKLYLNIPKLIFVVGLDRRVVEDYVRHHYKGNELDPTKAQHYLDKMFQVEIEIPPSQKQIEGYLEQQIDALDAACDHYWSNSLNGWNAQYRKTIERKVERLAEHNPREIKRLLNSTLLRATAAARNERLGGTEAERFTQGAQVFLIQRVLRRDVPNSYGLMLEKAALEFFERWSAFVRKHPQFDARREDVFPRGPFERPPLQLEPANRARPKEEEPPGSQEAAERKYAELRDTQPRYRDKDEAYPLLQNGDLWDLLQIPFSVSIAATVASERGPAEAARDVGVGVAPALPRALATSAEGAQGATVATIHTLPRAVQSAIAQSLKKSVEQLTADDLLAVRSINLDNADIADVTPLANLQNLQTLYLNSTQVGDVTPLAKLQNLQGLYLNGTQVSDVEPLVSLQNLGQLFLNNTQVGDVTPLAKLQNLQGLYLNGTQVSDVKPLASLQNLGQLFLNNTQVRDLTPLANLQNLQALGLSGTQVSDVTPLANLQNLQVLYLDSTQVSDVTPLAKLQNLQGLCLNSTQVGDVTPLANLQHLHTLSLNSTQVRDLTPLAKLQNLRRLYFKRTQVGREQIVQWRQRRPRLRIVA